jgi:hypothetical protein
MRGAVVGDRPVSFLELRWQEDLNSQELADRFRAWLHDQDFVEKKFPDIKEAEFCQLSITPI